MAFTTWSTTDKVNATLSGGDLVVTKSAANGGVRSADGFSSGKYYWEVNPTVFADAFGTAVGVCTSSAALSSMASSANGCLIYPNGWVWYAGSAGSLPKFTGLTAGTIIGIALDMDNKRIWFRPASMNWNDSGTANPATNTEGINISGLATGAMFAGFGFSSASPPESCTANFGGSAFSGTVPSGFTAGLGDAPAPEPPGASGPQSAVTVNVG